VPAGNPSGSFFGPETLVELLCHRARHQGTDRAFTFLSDGDTREQHLTYEELDLQARRIAARLQRLGLAGERVLLLYPPGLEFIAAFFGCLYAGVIAVPAYPPRLNRSLTRLRSILRDCSPPIALTTHAVRRRVQPLAAHSELNLLRWLATDLSRPGAERHWQRPAVRGDTLAMLQYTSGSTGFPKGVMLTHSNLLHNSALIAHAFEHTRSGTGVFWLPCYHDMGLIGGVLQPLYVGRPNILLSPMAFLQRPVRWLQAISRYRATTSGGPNFAYDLCLRKITAKQREGLDLSSWRVAFNGAEPVRAETLDAFAVAFAPCGFRAEAFYPCYGLAEATLLATGGYVSQPPLLCSVDSRELKNHRAIEVPSGVAGARRVVGCGHNLPDQRVLIVHPRRRVPCADNQVGEIWLQGPSVAQGYWQRPQDTRRVFRARLAGEAEGRFLRTRDLGFLRNGELFVTGRLKDLIIIRGLNHYPQDIEHTVEQSHPALRPGAGAAFTLDGDDRPRLVIVHEIERRQQGEAEDAIAAIRRRVDHEHGLAVDAVVMLRAGSVPKTSSGKIQRRACRKAFLHGTLAEVARWRRHETARHRENGHRSNGHHRSHRRRTETMEGVLSEVGRLAPATGTEAPLDATFGELGLDSLQRVELQAALEARFGGRLPEHVGPELQSLGDVVEAIEEYLVNSSAQKNGSSHGVVSAGSIPSQYYRLDHFPERIAMTRQAARLTAAASRNPFFQVQDPLPGGLVRIEGRELVNFASYDYLGLAHDPRVIEATQEAIHRYGTSVSGSRLVSGQRDLHVQLEAALARWLGVEAALAFVGGHATNVTTIGHLLGPSDLVVHDALAHNSIVEGCRLSGARRMPFPHNDADALDQMLKEVRGKHRRVLIAIEGLYSMDGDVPDLPRFIELKQRHKALLLVDEAHSLGVLGETGRGIGERFGIKPADVDIWMGTLSKALASCGGYIAGSGDLIEHLRYTAPGFVYSVGISPANAAAALKALNILESEPERVQTLHRRCEQFRRTVRQHDLSVGNGADTPIVPILAGDAENCLRSWQALMEQSISAQPILPPAVPQNSARLRFFITQQHSEKQIRMAVETLANLRRAAIGTGGRI
jgi:8-amino-7-oxononanoate synthase/acyl carrier protein